MNKFTGYLKIISSLCLLNACAISPKTYFYALQGLPTQPAPTTPLSKAYTYGIGPIFLSEPLMQPGVVAHVEGQQLDVSLYNVWAGNLQDAVTRVLASNLSELGNLDAVWPFPWDNRNRPTRQIRVVFEQLSGEVGGQLVLKAKWALTENNGETVRLQKRTVLRVQTTANTYAAYVDAINVLVNQLSAQMAHELYALDTAT